MWQNINSDTFILIFSLANAALNCFDCDPNGNQGIQDAYKECLTKDGKYGTKKQCDGYNATCTKATYGK